LTTAHYVNKWEEALRTLYREMKAEERRGSNQWGVYWTDACI